MFTTLTAKLLLATLLGAIIGLERESNPRGAFSIGGIRTFSLIGLLGGLAGLFYSSGYQQVAVIISVVLFLLLAISYYVQGSQSQELGMTSELSVVITFCIGMIVVTELIPLQLLVAIFVLMVLILSLKPRTKAFVAGVSRNEIQSLISYAIIALVILPFLPNQSFTLGNISYLNQLFSGFGLGLGKFSQLEIINPQRVWFVVALITGIDVFGYLLGKIIGQKHSASLTSFVAGFVSSTSATQSLAQKSKKIGVNINYLIGAAILANLGSFFQIFLLVGPLNPRWMLAIAPSVAFMIAGSAVIANWYMRRKGLEPSVVEAEEKDDKMFSLWPALKFAILLVLIKIITKVCLLTFGASGFIISSVLASFAGLDAILVTLAEMAGTTITFKFALLTFLLVNATNLFSKALYARIQGTKKFASQFLFSAFIIILLSFVGYFVA